MSVQFFRNDETVYMFDPETYQIHLRQGGNWVESNDLQLRESIRFRSIELSRKEALQLSGAESLYRPERSSLSPPPGTGA